MIAEATKYKNTGVAWLPQVPFHWDFVRLKTIVRLATNGVWGSEPKENENDIVCVRVADIDEWFFGISDADLTMRNINESDQEGRLLNYGDLIIEKSGGGDISPVGRVVIYNLNQKAVTSNFMARLNIVTDINREFLFYYFKFLYRGRLNFPSIKATTGIQNLDLYSYLQNPIPVPPRVEQDEIVSFINTQNKKINHFIKSKQHFIDLLKEQRQSIIDEALISNSQKIRLKYCVSKIGSGVTPKGGATVYQTSGIIFLRSQNIHNTALRLDDVAYITAKTHSEMTSSQVRKGDVLLNITGASIGRCFWFNSEEEANVNQHVSIIRPNPEILDSEFLMYQLQSSRIQNLINTVQGASREGLTIHEIKNYHLFVPTATEQKQIVSYIINETQTLDMAIVKAEKEIELMKEYREAMIAEAVTGKIKI